MKNDYISFKPTKKSFIAVNWALGSVCNYSCSYCVPKNYDGKIKFPDDYKPFIRLLDKVQEKYPNTKIQILLLGGEPTLWKHLEKFLNEMFERGISTRILSNGSRDLSWWKNIAHLIGHTIISYHPERASENHITELMKLFIPGKSQVNLMIPPYIFDEMIDIGKRISENSKVYVIPKFIRIDLAHELYTYTKEQLETFKKYSRGFGLKFLIVNKEFSHGFMEMKKIDGTVTTFKDARQIMLKNLNRWKGWKCWGGIESLFVDNIGDIFCCQSIVGKIGNINSPDYSLPDKPTICTEEFCNCTQDIQETIKEKIL